MVRHNPDCYRLVMVRHNPELGYYMVHHSLDCCMVRQPDYHSLDLDSYTVAYQAQDRAVVGRVEFDPYKGKVALADRYS